MLPFILLSDRVLMVSWPGAQDGLFPYRSEK
ncbi:hypothetical protein TFLX_00678 [Thermoflexales bacterium]|nr:hypothetical protein TFLX_00678 [Thermoflexales bacterium]